jgi:hypothetical protein
VIYLICDSYRQSDIWIRRSLGKPAHRAIYAGDVVVLSTYSETNVTRLGGRTYQDGDRVVRINRAPFGPYAEEIEDLLTQAGFLGHDSDG